MELHLELNFYQLILEIIDYQQWKQFHLLFEQLNSTIFLLSIFFIQINSNFQMKFCIDYQVDIINMSYGEDCHLPNSG